MRRRRFLSALLLPVLPLALPGCAGYVVGPIKPKRFADVHTIAVANFKNETLEPRIEVLLADTVIKQFQQDGTYKITREADADAILEVRLNELDRRPARSVLGNVLLAREYTLTLRARYELKNRKTGAVLDARNITGQTSFFVSGSSVLAADVNQDERQAVPLAAQDLAVHLVAQVAEGW